MTMRLIWNFVKAFILLIAIVIATVIASCSRESNHQAQGYIEGRYTYIATSVSGRLEQWFVERGSKVKQGELLFALEEQPEVDTYNEAIENLKQVMAARDAIAANLQYAKITYERYKILVPKKAIEQSQLDNAKSAYETITAQLAEANAKIASSTALLEFSKWNKDQKKIFSPIDAMVFDTYYRLGEYTQANQPILSLLAPADIKVIFYINEPSLEKLTLSGKISVQCDGCSESYPGKISFISPTAEYTPPVIYSSQTNSKLIYRIEAEFETNIAYHLHPGQPVTVTY